MHGKIEQLKEAGLAAESMDLVLSNCVLNLCPNKQRVLEQVYRVLAVGGEFFFSDVYCDRRLPGSVRQHKVRCLTLALKMQSFLGLLPVQAELVCHSKL